MTDVRDYASSPHGRASSYEDAPRANPTETRDRAPGGRFAPGNGVGKLGGRPPKARELAFLDATVEGCTPEQWTEVVAVVRKRALEGSAPHATLLARVLGLGRDDVGTGREGEPVEGLAGLLARPGAAEKVSALMDELFEGADGRESA